MMDLDSPGQVESPERMWVKVLASSTVPFSFEGRGKQRHRNTHELKVHQLLVHVEGWQEVGPVTVDQVGVFFRVAAPDPHIPTTQVSPGTVLFMRYVYDAVCVCFLLQEDRVVCLCLLLL